MWQRHNIEHLPPHHPLCSYPTNYNSVLPQILVRTRPYCPCANLCSWYAKASTVLFAGLSQPPETTASYHHTQMAKHSQVGNMPLTFINPILVHQTARQRTVIHHPTVHCSSGSVLYTTPSDVRWSKACMQLLCHEAPSTQSLC